MVLGLSPTGLAVARSLGRRGIPVQGADFDGWALGRFSRFVAFDRKLQRASASRDGTRLLAELQELADRMDGKPALFLTNDDYIELLAPHYGILSRSYATTTDFAAGARLFLDKRHFYRFCEERGIDAPRSRYPDDLSDVRAISSDLEFPMLLKPEMRHRARAALGGAKVLVVQDRGELVDASRRLLDGGVPFVVQEVIPGAEDRIQIAACYREADTRASVLFVGRKLRQYPPGYGSASLAESRWDEEVARRSLDLLERAGVEGLFSTEFKRDPRDGSLKIIEVNARASLWVALTSAAGTDVPFLTYRAATTGELPRARQVDGVTWSYLPRDVQTSLRYGRQGKLSFADWWGSVSALDCEAVLAGDDLRALMGLPLYAASRIRGRA